DRASLNQSSQRIAGGDPASVVFSGLVDTDLVGFRRIDAVQPNPRTLYCNGVAVGNSCEACYCRCRCCGNRTCKQQSSDQKNQGGAMNHGGIVRRNGMD